MPLADDRTRAGRLPVQARDGHGADPAADGAAPAGGAPAGAGDDEQQRLAAVRRLSVALDDVSGLDRLTGLAAVLLDAPKAQISLTGDLQTVVSAHGGVVDTDTPTGESLCTVTVRGGRPLAVEDAPTDDRVSGLPPVLSGQVAAYLGVPLRDARGQVLGALCVYDDEPRTWTPEQVGVLAVLAESALAELELRALSLEARATAARLDLVLDAADVGSFDLVTDTGDLHWDDRLVRMFGYDRDSFSGRLDDFNARVHPEDLPRVTAAIGHAVATDGEFAEEYRVLVPGGQLRWVAARGRVLPAASRDASPHLLGVAYDTTELRSVRDRLARVLETMNDAFFALDDQWRFTYVNQQAERLLLRARDELLGRDLWEEFPEALGTAFQTEYERAVRSGEQVVFEAPFDPLAGWYEVSAWPGPDGLSVYFREVTRRREIEHDRERAYAEREQAVVERERAYAAAEAANTRLALLADAATRLGASLEPRQVLERLSEVVVPDLGRWVVVALTTDTAALLRGQEVGAEPDRVHVVHVAHAHPELREELVAQVAATAPSTHDASGIGAVVRTGRVEWLPPSPEAPGEGLRAVETGALLTLPLSNRGRVLGAMTVAAPAGGPVDRALLTDLAGRAAVALDNALLFGAERRTGITLQRSLLPRDLPVVPGLLTAARYLPGTTGAFVGGDWYQGVRVGDGLLLAMGDVMGHGMRSAARMGQLRAITATLALEGHGPAALLTRLASNVDVLLDLELATMLVAAYDPASRTLTVASAGHPPPLLAPLSGPAVFVDVEPGPPLGSFRHVYEEVVVELLPGATLVLYTDGLVEDREDSLEVGLERLRLAVEEVRLPPDEVCDHVLDTLGRGAGGDDDVALLVLTHRLEDGA